jgi:pyruvate dehydrogenase kinase 2/3/4
MREEWASNVPISSQGLTRSGSAFGLRGNILASRAMKLKLSGQISREISERRQVGDAEEMFREKGGPEPWWRNVGMEEGM